LDYVLWEDAKGAEVEVLRDNGTEFARQNIGPNRGHAMQRIFGILKVPLAKFDPIVAVNVIEQELDSTETNNSLKRRASLLQARHFGTPRAPNCRIFGRVAERR